MAKDNFKNCLSVILEHEGGYVDHPKDPGGATNMGITKQTYEDWFGKVVTKDKIQNLTEADVTPIYKKNYWAGVLGDDLPKGLDLAVFDMCVNSGRHRATKFLQMMVGSKVDGWIGPNTISKTNGYVEATGITNAINEYSKIRQEYYESLATFKTFGNGWTSRVKATQEKAIAMAE
jgi:lysozyme family protein